MHFETIASGYKFVEAPRVDKDGTIYFSDLLAGGIHAIAPDGSRKTYVKDRIWIGGMVLTEDGNILAAGRDGLIKVDLATGASAPFLTSINGEPIIAMNDCEAASNGGIYGGTIDFVAIFERGEAPSLQKFFYMAPDGQIHVVRDDIPATNGIAVSPDGTKLYHSETGVGVWVYEVGADFIPHSPKLLVKLEDSDGLVVDAEGGIWVACWQTGRVFRFNPDGSVALEGRVPVPHAVSLAFGGADMRDLYVSVGSDMASGKVTDGGILKLRTDVPGLQEYRARF